MVCAGLALTGACLRGIVQPVWESKRGLYALPVLDTMEHAVGHGLSLGVLGGFSSIAADLAWLKTYFAWEQRDFGLMESLLNLTTALDGGPLNFWLNGARMIAYDSPAWTIDARLRSESEPGSERTRLAESRARCALSFLERGLIVHSTSAAMWIERANIELNCLRDVAAAAESYRNAARQPGAPYYAARIHVELLRRLGRKSEALAALIELYPTLPKNVEAAAPELVLIRIRELENDLMVAPEKRFALNAKSPVRPLTAIHARR